MYARIVKMDVPAEKLDESERIYEDVIDGAKNEQGFQGAILLSDPATGKSISITLWEDESAMLRTEESGWWQAQIARFKEVMVSGPVREHYEVEFARFPAKPVTRPAHEEEGEPARA